MDKRTCAICKTTKNLMTNPYSRRTTKSKGVINSFMCRPCNSERMARYRATKNGRERTRIANLKSQKKYYDKHLSRQKLHYNINQGKVLTQYKCEDCASEHFVEAHHPDYAKPLDVRWLCKLCHSNSHRVI